ncbi:cytochrome P450 4F5-like [Actinia tenebrosa]|uniref:Cytochrome P450 4F5-like n=1 Tax=Actinia tenebrosa TaxID=6105 RepID=A0A6P8HTD7_ACTTE|nr:cytochrome P450 4F5-like [Actinia tenebrosa]
MFGSLFVACSSWGTLLSALITFILVWIVYRTIQFRYSSLSKIPGPPGLPIIGGTRVNVTGPQNLKHVLITHRHKYVKTKNIRAFVPSVGNGLLTCSHDDHVRQYKMVSPAFSYSNLKGMVAVFQQVAHNLVKTWTDKLSSSPSGFCDIEAQKDLNHCTLDIIGKCAFGYDFDSVFSGDNQLAKAFTSIIQVTNFSHLLLMKLFPFYKYFYTESKNAMKITDEIVLEVIHKKMNSTKSQTKKKDLLDRLLEHYDGASKKDVEEMRSQVFTFLLAGHETSSVALAWTLYELSKNPEIQTRAREEVFAVLGKDLNIEWSKLDELKFLGNIVKESLRLHSPVYHVVRQAIEDDVIDGYLIPKGTTVAVGIQTTHILPKYWKDPDIFIPDRFQENDGQPSNIPNIFLPFSIGPRSCIGNKFALAEIKTVLATLLKNFVFTECSGMEFKPVIQITVRPNPSLHLLISKIKG